MRRTLGALVLFIVTGAGCIGRPLPSPPDGGGDAAAPPDDATAPPDGATAPPDGGLACQQCTSFSSAVNRGAIGQSALVETSGLAASRLHPGVLYAHNDSGDTARFFALDDRGAPLGEFILEGATAVDWEDIAVGPCPSGSCVYLGDIGSNNGYRLTRYIYRVPEPDVAVGRPAGLVTVTYDRLSYVYSKGASPDAETLLVHPVSGKMYVVEKVALGQNRQSAVHSLSIFSDSSGTAQPLGYLTIPRQNDVNITGGDIHPCGNAILLRTYGGVYRLTLPAGADFNTIFTQPVEALTPSPPDVFGESITWAADGQGYYTTSEGSGQPLYYTGCR
jgi:hypothetical protein